jgi:excisionase family DNA binding protein
VANDLDRCLTPKKLARRWGVRLAVVNAMIRSGELPAITIGSRIRVTPEAIAAAERGPLAIQPIRRNQPQETISDEARRLLGL